MSLITKSKYVTYHVPPSNSVTSQEGQPNQVTLGSEELMCPKYEVFADAPP